ncbi:hypothetical protein ACIBCT_05870 [Streptosporangium sp. NPDC050855]|uniref:hypothetical protein n=1 Tax=Streptosporangium sp. NPDC050855 TaxID=3366194 RepID=UPI00379E9198
MPLWQVSLLGLVAGLVAGLLVTLLVAWLDTFGSGSQGFVFDWRSAVGYMIFTGPMTALMWFLTVRRRREAADRKAQGTASGAAERVPTGGSR